MDKWRDRTDEDAKLKGTRQDMASLKSKYASHLPSTTLARTVRALRVAVFLQVLALGTAVAWTIRLTDGKPFTLHTFADIAVAAVEAAQVEELEKANEREKQAVAKATADARADAQKGAEKEIDAARKKQADAEKALADALKDASMREITARREVCETVRRALQQAADRRSDSLPKAIGAALDKNQSLDKKGLSAALVNYIETALRDADQVVIKALDCAQNK